MSTIKKLVYTSIVLCCLGCSDLQVKTDATNNLLSQYKNYAWYFDGNSDSANREIIADLHPIVLQEVNTLFAQKGYRQSPAEEAEFFINYHLSVEDVLNLEQVETYAGYGPGFVFRRGEGVSNKTYVESKEVDVEHFRKGALVIDIIDARNDQLIWRGEADKHLEEGRISPEKRKTLIYTAVSRLLSSIPESAK